MFRTSGKVTGQSSAESKEQLKSGVDPLLRRLRTSASLLPSTWSTRRIRSGRILSNVSSTPPIVAGSKVGQQIAHP